METILKLYEEADKPTKNFILHYTLSLLSDEQTAILLRIVSQIADSKLYQKE